MSADKIFNTEEKAKLNSIVTEGIGILGEIEVLNGGLNDTIKAIAEELEIKPSILKKAIKTAYKSNFHVTKDDYDLLETILDTVGRTE
jgi:DNA-binding MarR family transcriptional regulator